MSLVTISLRYRFRLFTVLACGASVIDVFDSSTGKRPELTSGVWHAASNRARQLCALKPSAGPRGWI